ncbi:restriction endonuclease subunit S [Pasteurella multocida]|uniref:restriction endonuclease subunit S n=1 Tax=Pasteurella multocida TaxID=747 RepID=UPI0039788D47
MHFKAHPTITDAWEQRKLGNVVDIIGGGTPDTSIPEYWEGDIDWYSPTEIGEQIYAKGSIKKITELGLQKSSAKILPAKRTILFTSRASIGDMAILAKSGTTNQGFQSFVLKGDSVDLYFLFSLGHQIKRFALKHSTGSTFLEISKTELGKMNLYLPKIQEQQKIGSFFTALDRLITTHQRK